MRTRRLLLALILSLVSHAFLLLFGGPAQLAPAAFRTLQVKLSGPTLPRQAMPTSEVPQGVSPVLSRITGSGPTIRQLARPAHTPPQQVDSDSGEPKQPSEVVAAQEEVALVEARKASPFVIPDWLQEAAGAYFKASEVDERALPAIEPVPRFPDSAEAARSGRGVVRLRLFINEWGGVDDAYVESADPPYVFDDAAITAFRTAWFYPAVRQGRFVKSQKLIEVVFGDATESVTEPGLGTDGGSAR